MKKTALAVLIALGTFVGAAAAQDGSTPPEWWVDHANFVVEDDTSWITPNPDVTDHERSPDHYGMTWRWRFVGRVLEGRLFGLRDGEIVGQYWTFVEYWHPGERHAVLEQWGANGAFGFGYISHIGENRFEVDQTFWSPAGDANRSGHRTFENGDIYDSETFSISGDGEWVPTGGFVWGRVPTSSLE